MPIHYASQNGCFDIVKLLVEAGGIIDAPVLIDFFSYNNIDIFLFSKSFKIFIILMEFLFNF